MDNGRSLLNEILERLDMDFYLDREGIDYKVVSGSSGVQLNLKICPFCGNDKWKVYINAGTGLGNCFAGSCDKRTFNKYSFIRGYTGLSGKSLYEHVLCVGSEIGWRPPRKSVAVENRNALVLPDSLPLPINGKNLKYLENRNISPEMCRYFHLRFCHRGGFNYTDPQGRSAKMAFDKRVIIPVYDMNGALVSFQGRDITGTSDRKYLFPPGFAATGSHLYNAHNVWNTKRVLLCEGVFDVIAAKIALDDEVELRDVVPVGSFGKHLSVRQYDRFVNLKERGVKQVTFMWDGEEQATKDAIEAGMKLSGMGMDVKVALLPKGKDPNEVTREELRRCFYCAMPLTKTNAVKMLMRVKN